MVSAETEKKNGETEPAQNAPEEPSSSVPSEIPILPTGDMVIFPRMILPLLVKQENLVKMIEDLIVGDRILGTVLLRQPEVEEVKPENLYSIGTASIIHKMVKMFDGGIRLLVQGLERVQIQRFSTETPYFRAAVEILEDRIEEGEHEEIAALMVNIRNMFQRIMELSPHLPSELGAMLTSVEEPGSLADLLSANLNIPLTDKQEILETLSVLDRLKKVLVKLNQQLEVLELGNKIQSQVKEGIDKSQREYFLREQLKAIQKELGEKDERTVEIEELRERLEKAGLPEGAMKEALRELDRLASMPPAAAEYTVARTYLEWLIELPWNLSTEDNLDISAAKEVLDEDHYNLEKLKKRVIEYLAVRQLKKDMKGPILCFVGPPGTGKTSLGQSIARALGRKFMRISLGGVRDEAEIRGHRRTYVGALPGRIIQGIRRVGFNNPVFMLDEIDKLGMDFRGDPSSALLEVLDPEQNFSFSDHYLDVEFDLSRVMFIATANILDTIPPALLDRMEVLNLPGYTEEEKLGIARKYLIPRQIREHGIREDQLRIEDEAVKAIIRGYTREAGLRNLEREIATICRGVARKVVEGHYESITIRSEDLHEYLGAIKFIFEAAERTAEPGVATGLAWTPAGGDILFVEATRMPGKQNLTLTGSLGEIMKESAQAALSYIRSRSQELDIPEDIFSKNDIHIHVPAGAIPKDGPSAGVTIFTALVSLLTDRPVRSDIAMTGEITLRGLVLPVGGIKEKVLAAHRAGLRQVILPRRNEKDLEDIPETVKKDMTFHFVDRMSELVNLSLRRDGAVSAEVMNGNRKERP
ncbi:MAG: endopeptidase La [Deltaproteobacteria bacterium]|nr:endopeptidase La [Deltaproteobacteria bacterium]